MVCIQLFQRCKGYLCISQYTELVEQAGPGRPEDVLVGLRQEELPKNRGRERRDQHSEHWRCVPGDFHRNRPGAHHPSL